MVLPVRRLTLFAFLWLTVGFSGGTSLLLGAVRGLADRLREAGWSEAREGLVVKLLIVLLACGSAVVAAWLSAVVARSRLWHVKLGLPALALLAALSALGLWMTPGTATAGAGEEETVGARFTFGPLPSAERMAELRREGYTAVISLLHPAVVPFEPRLIAEGRAAAERAGLEYVHLPMLPWIGDNAEALRRIEEIARTGAGRYYVHCYLGQDRVRLARKAVEAIAPRGDPGPAGPEGPTLSDRPRFERGEVVEVAEGLYLTPFPTDDEFMRYVLPLPRVTVVSLLDPGDVEDRPWIEKERRLLEAHRVPFEPRPLPHEPADPAAVARIAREVASMPRPVVVHAFLAAGSGRSAVADALLEALRSLPASAAPRREARSVVPSARTVVLAWPPLVLVTAAAAALAGWLRTAAGLDAPYSRKVFHFAIFTVAGGLHLAGGLPIVVLFGVIVAAAVLYALARGEGFAFYEALARPSDAPRRTLFVVVPLATTAVGGLASALLFGPFAHVGYLVAGWGDAVGEPVGRAFGRHRYRVPSLAGVPASRSAEGSAAVFVVGTLAAFLGLMLGGSPAALAASSALACGAVGAAVEAFSNHGLDNLTVQVAAAGTAWLILS